MEKSQNTAPVICISFRSHMEPQVAFWYSTQARELGMRTRLKPLIVMALLALGAGGAAESKAPPKSSPPPAQKPASTMKTPMVFYLAKGEPDACGLGCSAWIAADGEIDADASQRFRAFLKRQSGPKRPIYFQSPGGSVTAALAIGRMLRERGLTAGVARTVPEGCPPGFVREEGCEAIKRSGRELKAALSSVSASCSSACVYTLVGASSREVAPQALLGVHASTINTNKIPKGVRIPSKLISQSRAEGNRRIARYLAEMGMQRALLDAAEKYPHETIHYLTREEIVQFGIDPRRHLESQWAINDSTGKVRLTKMFAEMEPGDAHFQIVFLGVQCGVANLFSFQYTRRIDPGEEPNPKPLKISAASVAFNLTSTSLVNGKEPNSRFDVRYGSVPFKSLQGVAADDHIQIAEVPKDEQQAASSRAVTISTLGLNQGLTTLTQRCSDQVSKPPPGFNGVTFTPAAPRQSP
jgi:hypothetical protein